MTDAVHDRARLLVAELADGPFGAGRDVESLVSWVASTGSTNSDLARRAANGAANWTVLVSDHQSTGRGRFQRVWQAPPGLSVAVSVLVRVHRPLSEWPWLSLLTGMAVREAVGATGADCQLKWPNDVLAVDGRKLCGILSERVDTPDGPAAVIGFGINTALRADQVPVPTATSLAMLGVDPDPVPVVAGALHALAARLDRWLAGEDLTEEYADVCGTVGRQVRLLTDADGDVWVEGVAVGVDAGGRLLIRGDDGVTAWSAGDVVHLR